MLSRTQQTEDWITSAPLRSVVEPSLQSQILRALLGYWMITAACIILSVAATIAYLLHAPKIFTAQSDLLIETNLPAMFQFQSQEPLVALDTPQIETQLAILRSDRITEKVIEVLGMMEEPSEAATPRVPGAFDWLSTIMQDVRAPFNPPAAVSDRKRDLIAAIQQNLDVRRQGLSHVINITYDSGDAVTAAKLANAVAQSYVNDQLESRSLAAEQSGKWLETRIAGLRDQMNAAAHDVQRYRVRRGYRIEPDAAGAKNLSSGSGAPSGTDDKTTLEELESRLETYRKIYQSYLQAYADTVQRQSYPVASARVITPARPPLKKSKPRTLPALIAGTAAGGLLGVAITLLILARTLRRRDHAERMYCGA